VEARAVHKERRGSIVSYLQHGRIGKHRLVDSVSYLKGILISKYHISTRCCSEVEPCGVGQEHCIFPIADRKRLTICIQDPAGIGAQLQNR
jgi:hypothetical protein